MFNILATAPNWDGLYESLWGNSAGLVASVIIGIVLALLVFRFLRKTVFRIIVVVLIVAVVGFFALRVADDAITINDLKDLNIDCETVLKGDGGLDLSKLCPNH